VTEAAKELRAGNLDEETLKNLKSTLDRKFSGGRTFTSDDREKLKEIAKNSQRPDSTETPVGDSNRERARSPEGRVRNEISGNASDLKAVRSHEGELKQDDANKASEAGQVHVAPEYKKSVEDYYKAISK
jgi:hypothetical protein